MGRSLPAAGYAREHSSASASSFATVSLRSSTGVIGKPELLAAQPHCPEPRATRGTVGALLPLRQARVSGILLGLDATLDSGPI